MGHPDSRDSSVKALARKILLAFVVVFPTVFVALTYLEDIAESTGADPRQFISFVMALPLRIVDLSAQMGYLGVFILMLLESAAFPIPSEIILPFSGYLVSQQNLNFWPVVFYSTLAAVIGSFIDYYVGLRLGRALLTGQLRIPLVNANHLRKVESWFHGYGALSVALFRVVPAARVLISFPAGAFRMSKTKFAIYTVAGCLPWNIALVYLGWWLGSSWNLVVDAFRFINLAVYISFAVFIAWLAIGIRSRRKPNSGLGRAENLKFAYTALDCWMRRCWFSWVSHPS